jgi:hypothetical protein
MENVAYWMSPWRTRITKEGQALFVADVAPSREQRRQHVEVCFEQKSVRSLSAVEQKKMIAEAVDRALAQLALETSPRQEI